ncbi:MAG TPA: DUF2235 domain-containing protein [Bryobacteraceae bacterium]|jgi:uncharacterized protein (DUF2235 family)|nr:DUF2235 domain-containing protein [Bryobacteraceae bacterium]
MSKNIVICSDGTGNTAIKGRGTNVFKLYEAVDLIGHKIDPALAPQISIYDDGVGNEDFKPFKLFAGITGFGLARNVRLLYKSLVRVYDPGDRIFLFGFSRGAFTVRTLSGLIAVCGILDIASLPTTEALDRAVKRAYRAYRQEYHTKLALLLGRKGNRKLIARFEQRYVRHTNVRIRFIGAWESVDAVGAPWHIGDYINATIHRFKFPDLKLGPEVDFACQALAIDDERRTFHPLLWEHDPRLEQVWFAGCHSNVGGGYEKQGLSLVTLDWMLRQAQHKAGLRLLASDRALYREHANVDDKLFDSRAGTGILYRWLPRDMEAICARHNVPPLIHLSVLERLAHGTGDYAPGNIAPFAKVVITHSDDPIEDPPVLGRARAAEAVLHAAHRDGKSLLSRVKLEVLIGRASYYVYLITCSVVLLAAAFPERTGLARLQPQAFLSFAYRLATSPLLVLILAGGVGLSYFMAVFSARRMSAAFSEFWHDEQPKLREVLEPRQLDDSPVVTSN